MFKLTCSTLKKGYSICFLQKNSKSVHFPGCPLRKDRCGPHASEGGHRRPESGPGRQCDPFAAIRSHAPLQSSAVSAAPTRDPPIVLGPVPWRVSPRDACASMWVCARVLWRVWCDMCSGWFSDLVLLVIVAAFRITFVRTYCGEWPSSDQTASSNVLFYLLDAV